MKKKRRNLSSRGRCVRDSRVIRVTAALAFSVTRTFFALLAQVFKLFPPALKVVPGVAPKRDAEPEVAQAYWNLIQQQRCKAEFEAAYILNVTSDDPILGALLTMFGVGAGATRAQELKKFMSTGVGQRAKCERPWADFLGRSYRVKQRDTPGARRVPGVRVRESRKVVHPPPPLRS